MPATHSRARVRANRDQLSFPLPVVPALQATNVHSQDSNDSPPAQQPSPPTGNDSTLQLLTPVLVTLLASGVGILPATQPWMIKTCGHVFTLQAALAVLMLAMGLTMTPEALEAALQQPRVILLNMLLCFGAMPLMALLVTVVLGPTLVSPSQRMGTILLGCVSGGQASNLFTLLAGGDVALSVICTLSTTLVGVVATPLLVQALLGASVPVQALGVLKSVATLVLLPLVTGLALGRFLSAQWLQTLRSQYCQRVGLGATMILVAGGASNAAASMAMTNIKGASSLLSTIGISVLLPLMGGAAALGVASFLPQTILPEASKRALVIEVLSKSPTLAHVLALRHFGVAAASIPAVSMVSLALVGALVASTWQGLDPR